MTQVHLPKSGGTAIASVLERQHLEDVLLLQEETRAALTDDHKMFVLPQSSSYFEKLLSRETGLMVGLRAGSKLVAQIAVMGPMTLEEAIDRDAITRSDVTFHHAAPSETVVVAKSMAVHPGWIGNGLSQHLLQAAIAQPVARIADHIFAQISVANGRSWDLFLKNGFGIVAAATDPLDQQPRFVLQKPALGFRLHSLPSIEAVDPLRDFASILRLTQREALVGQADESGQLAFHARTEFAASWYDTTPAGGQA